MRPLVTVQAKKSGEWFIYPYSWNAGFSAFKFYGTLEDLEEELWKKNLVMV